MACRSASRSRSRAAPDHRFLSSSALNSYAVSALSWLLRIRVSTEARKSRSWAMRIWASKMRDSSGPARWSTRSPRPCRWETTYSTASRKRRTSSSTWSGRTVRSGTSGKSIRTMKAGAQATPGDTPIPRSDGATSVLPETAGHQLGQRRHRLLGVGAVGADRDEAAALRGEHHDAHDALGVHFQAVLGQRDVGLERAGQPHDARGRAGVQALLVHDGGLTLDHRPTRRKKTSSAIASRAKRTLVSEGPNHRDTAAPTPATASAPIAPIQPKPRRYQPATSGTASPTAPPATGPMRATARGIQDVLMADPTRMPASKPVRSAQTAVPSRIAL